MKRSEINQILQEAKQFLSERKFHLPPWAYWSPGDWIREKRNATEIVENMLGWDITDFGCGDFANRGLFLFTIRNGRPGLDRKPYAEKIMIVKENQETPFHFHWHKMEDIINRGGGNLVVDLYHANPDETLSEEPVSVSIDGIVRTVEAGGRIILQPGESICLDQRLYHRFYGEPGKGPVLVGEVSMVNVDKTDNRFYEPVGRFPTIEEDEPPVHLLVTDYEKFLN